MGLSSDALEAHIAWDPGALGRCQTVMSRLLDAALIFQNFSRLAYDCNRPPEAPDAMPVRSEIIRSPAMSISIRAIGWRAIEEIYRPVPGTALKSARSKRGRLRGKKCHRDDPFFYAGLQRCCSAR
jgi:predicted N-formylglutamate amidohydrolase